MKKRNRSRRQQHASTDTGWWNTLGQTTQRRRSVWTFERLEERYYFTASPITGLGGIQDYGVSNSTAAGQQLIDAIAQMWAAQATTSSSQSGSNSVATRSVPTDPYLNYQWHLFNVGQVVNPGQFQDLYGVPGQDANVIPAWDLGYTGAGINVAVVDSGVQLNHPDLADNINLQYGYDALRNRPGGGPQGGEGHGTAVAGLIAAVANNGQGGTGVAYGATIIPIRLISATGTLDFSTAFINAIGANGAPVDIYNHSWGPNDAIRAVDGPDMNQLIALTNSARLGRNGLGAIHVWAAGNGAENFGSAGSDGYVNSRYTIAVGVVDHDGQIDNSDGTATTYGEMAPSVLIVAPSASGPTDIINNFATGSGLFTTDLTDNNLGYNIPPLPSGIDLDIDTFPDDDYTSRFGGTSGAAPIVSGVIALMLEANPNLTYRDVQEILVRSARQNDDLDESWITNLVPLFRDPVPHNPSSPNYTGEDYPDAEDQWNDEIVYQVIPGVVTTPAVQAQTDMLTSTNGVTFSIHALADGPHDGTAGNDIDVVFVTSPGQTGATADLQGTTITITVHGTPNWIAIQQAVDSINGGGDFELIFAASADPSKLFSPADTALTGQLTGGVDEVGMEPTVGRAPGYESYHPIADPITNREPLSLFTNGAGFTVSHGRNVSEYGYAHGVVNAALAVELARQWHLKDQNLPPEKTYLVSRGGQIRLRAAQITDEASGEYVIPGALSWSTEGFADFFNEFFKEPTVTAGDPMGMPPTMDMIDPESLPFSGDDPPVNTRGGFDSFEVPAIDEVTGASNVMSLEWVEVHVRITGDADAMNYLKITLVSPDGTHSELTQNHYRPEDIIHSFQSMATAGTLVGFGDSITPVDENGTQSNTLDWVYSTNRIWGERSDSAPLIDSNTGAILDSRGKDWELHFENYSGSDLITSDIQIAFHGAPVGSPAGPVERIMGKVGVDSGRFIQAGNQIIGANDGVFNFDRYGVATRINSHALTSVSGPYGPSGVTPPGSFDVRVADGTQERFAENITVYAIDNATGQRVAEFLTGYDGNYFFDLPEGEYTIGVEDPLGRSALDSGLNYDNEWVVTIDTTDGLRRTAGQTHLEDIDLDGDGMISLFETDIEVFDTEFNNLNFLLDPGSLPPDQVVFTGQVVGDLDGDGTQDVQDTGVYNFVVYADLNHTNQFEIGEPFTVTDIDGNYTLPVPTATPNTFTIGVKAPTGWTPTSPPSGFLSEYALPGEQVDGFKFLFEPPSEPSGEGNGTIFGLLFDDKNGDGIQDVNEKGLANFKVFLDANGNGMLDGSETFALTNSNGAYQFGEVGLGKVRIDVVINEPYQLTSPLVMGDDDGYIELTLVPGQVSKENDFGIRNLATDDYGDLVGDDFKTTGEQAARHNVVQGFSLGSSIDAEIRPRSLKETAPGSGTYEPDPTQHGVGDDQAQSEASFDDEDGVVLLGSFLRPGANTLQVTVNGVGGYLQGWIDFNNNGKFDSEPELGERVFTNADLNQGMHPLVVDAPASLVGGQMVAARFRWGTMDTDYYGLDIIGEVEDYLFVTKVPVPGDYNADDVVNDDDYLLWKSTFGSTTDRRADGNGNGVVDSADYTIWRNNLGAGPGAGGGGGGGGSAVALASIEPTSEPIAQLSSAPSPVVSAAAANARLAHQLALEAWQARQASRLSAAEVARLTRLGAQTAVVNGVTRYAYTVPSVGQGSGGLAALSRNELPSNEVTVAEAAPSNSVSLLDLSELHFSTTVGHSLDTPAVHSGVITSADRADLVMLLLASGNVQRERSDSDDDAFAANADWLSDDDENAELDLALAAAFEDESDWWLAL